MVPRRRSPTAATTSPTTAPSTRRSARSRRRRRSSPRPSRSASGPSSTSSPTTSRTGTPGSRRRSPRARARPSASGSGSARARAERRRDARRTGARTSRATHVDAHDEPRRHARRVVPAPVHARAARPQLGPPRRARASTRTILRFWFDRGAAGVRIDSAALLVKDPALPEVPASRAPGEHPHHDRDELHDIYRGWRADRRLATRARASSSARCGSRTSSGSRCTSARTSSTRPSTSTSWPGRGTPGSLRESIDATLAAHAPVGAPATWVLSNHDVTRPVTRYGRGDISFAFARKRFGTPDGPRARASPGAGRRAADRGAARARCTSTRATSWASTRSRSRSTRSRTRCTSAPGGIDPGRDGCRVPLPWSGDAGAVRVQPGRRAGAAVADPAGPLGGADGRGRAADPARCSTCTGRRSWTSGAPSPASGTAR